VIDKQLASRAFLMFMRGRYNIMSTGLSQPEQELFHRAMTRVLPQPQAPTRERIEVFSDAMRALMNEALEQYEAMKIGSWAAGGFRAIASLGLMGAAKNDSQRRVIGVSRVEAQVTMAAMFPDRGTTDSAVLMLIKFLLKDKLGDVVKGALEAQTKEHTEAIEHALTSPSIAEWLRGVTEAATKTDALFVIYRCVLEIVRKHMLSQQELETLSGLSMATCLAEENRLDELSANTASFALYSFMSDPLACPHYFETILQLAREQGPLAAKRQTKFDCARFMIPRFLADEAIIAVNRSQ